MAGLITGADARNATTAFFDNLLINSVGGAVPQPTAFAKSQTPIYKP